MLDWYVQAVQGGQQRERPLPFSSAEEAIEAGNETCRSSVLEEVVVYHRIYSNQACLRFSKAMPEDEVKQKAAQLEQQVRRAAKMG